MPPVRMEEFLDGPVFDMMENDKSRMNLGHLRAISNHLTECNRTSSSYKMSLRFGAICEM